MKEISEDDIHRLQRGEIRGLEAAHDCYGGRVYDLCRRMLGDPADAEDAVQEVFLRLFDQAAKFSGRSRFSTWLYRLAANHCLNAVKSRQRKSLLSLSEISETSLPKNPQLSPVEVAASVEERELADRLLDQLGPDFKAVVVLREIEGLAYAEIAEVLDLPVGTVMSRLSRAREKLTVLIAELRLRGLPGGRE